MDIPTLFVIATGLAMDAFAVCLGVGALPITDRSRSVLRMSFHMGLFQGLMAFLGWLAGSSVVRLIERYDHWIALALLGYIGVNMIRSGLSGECASYGCDPTRGRTLVMLCVACSIDALAVGLSLAMLKVNILSTSVVIAVVTLGLSLMGMLAGSRLGEVFGKRMEILGGFLLNGIGLRIFLTHVF